LATITICAIFIINKLNKETYSCYLDVTFFILSCSIYWDWRSSSAFLWTKRDEY